MVGGGACTWPHCALAAGRVPGATGSSATGRTGAPALNPPRPPRFWREREQESPPPAPELGGSLLLTSYFLYF
jgi:hypothetical protein